MSNVVRASYDENAANTPSNENAANALEEYHAFEAFQVGSKRPRKLLMIDSAGRLLAMPAYSYYQDGFSTNPRYWWLLFSTCAFCIKGRNLPGELLALFVEDRLKALRCFNPARHAPPDADAILIESITRHNLKDFTAQQMKDAANGE